MADADDDTEPDGDGEGELDADGEGDDVNDAVGVWDAVVVGVGDGEEEGELVVDWVGDEEGEAEAVGVGELDADCVDVGEAELEVVGLGDTVADAVGVGEAVALPVPLGDALADAVGVGDPLAVCDGVGVLDASGADSNTTTAIDSGACPRSGSPMTSSSTDTRTDVAVIPFGPNNTGHAPSPPVRPVCDATAKLDDSSPLANVYVVYGGVWSDTDTTVAGPCCAYQDDPSMESVPDSNTMNPIVSAPDLPLESSPEWRPTRKMVDRGASNRLLPPAKNTWNRSSALVMI